MIDHEHTLLGFLRLRTDELRRGDKKQNVDESMFMHEFGSWEMVPPKDAIGQACWTGAAKECIRLQTEHRYLY